jgi:hypothetical protein
MAVVVAAVGLYRRRSEEEGGGGCPGPGAATRRQGMRGGGPTGVRCREEQGRSMATQLRRGQRWSGGATGARTQGSPDGM